MENTVDTLIESLGGLAGACAILGWQGGTIHQARAEILKRLGRVGIVPRKTDGVLVTLTY